MKWKPHAYQKRCIQFGIENAAAGFLLDPGMGKTTIMLAIFKLLRAKGMVKRMLVVAPLRAAQSTWPREAAKWDEFAGLKVAVLHGAGKSARAALEADVCVINPEGLPWLFDEFANGTWPWEIFVSDESTRFKHTNTARFKILRPHLGKFRRRYILTGTPAPNGLMDLFGQIYLLDLGHTFTPYITRFRSTFFNQHPHNQYLWTPKADAESRIYSMLRPLVIRMDAKDYLDLPPLMFNTILVELPSEARRVYDQMEETLVADVKAGLVTAANAATASGKCRQISNGGLYYMVRSDGEVERKWEHLHDAKTEAVRDLVEERQGAPSLIAYEFEHDLDRLRQMVGDHPHIGGGVTAKKFREIEEAWNRGDLPVLYAQPSSVAHGLNLQSAPRSCIIEYGLTWDHEVREQFHRRLWRQGRNEPVVVHSVVAERTIDEIMLKALARKDNVQRALLNALKER